VNKNKKTEGKKRKGGKVPDLGKLLEPIEMRLWKNSILFWSRSNKRPMWSPWEAPGATGPSKVVTLLLFDEYVATENPPPWVRNSQMIEVRK